MGNDIRRTGDLRVKLSPDMLQRLEALATDYGMPSATFAAFAIADYIVRQENSKRNVSEAVLDVTRRAGDQMQANLSDEQLEKVFGPMIAAIAQQSALSQPNLPLDGEAAPISGAA